MKDFDARASSPTLANILTIDSRVNIDSLEVASSGAGGKYLNGWKRN